MRLAMLLMMELVRWPLCVDAELVYHTRFVLTSQAWVSYHDACLISIFL